MRKTLLFSAGILLLAAALFAQLTYARNRVKPAEQTSPIHPTFALLDASGANVLDSNGPVSTMQTCGQCHDTEFIASHSFHSDLGLSAFTTPGGIENGRAWDQSNGPFGKWEPLTYRYLSPAGDVRQDLDVAGWAQLNAARLPGGGPLVDKLPVDQAVELDCFLCHFETPDNAARTRAIQAGQFAWANTASLLSSGLATQEGDSYTWQTTAFDADGKLRPEFLKIQDPTNANCARCHGVAHSDLETALTVDNCDLGQAQTATTGQVFSAQRISDSGMNISGKQELSRSWDIHAERGVQCTDCHYSLNNPVYYQATSQESPAHLEFDPRRLELGEYLEKPDHNLARGQSAQNTLAPELKGSMRRCEGCHNAVDSHDWLPYAEQHMTELACESCHIQQTYAPAIQSVDWTVLQSDGTAVTECRGVDGATGGLNDLVTGFQPVLLPRSNIDGSQTLAPYNLITTSYWVYDDPNGPRPVRLADLQSAYFENSAYAPAILAAFDSDGSGELITAELVIDTDAKQSAVAGRLEALGLVNPRIESEIQPYSINHGVGNEEWATQDCKACHNSQSLAAAPIELSGRIPGGIQPVLVGDSNARLAGAIENRDGKLVFQADPSAGKLYVFGHSRVSWIDWFGALAFVGVLGAVAAHGGLRFAATMKQPKHEKALKKVYMYGVYERFWHWLQTFAIVLLLFTGLIIHRPDIFGVFNFRYVVLVHNVLAALLVLNAFLSLFYHLASGEIRQFIPRPYGFFDQAIVQAKFYIQGIFKGKEHPFEKTPEKKLNPLQQATYFGILNVLLPLQIVTGALMWGVQHWPQIGSWFGGLPVLAPFHSLVAWLFGAFIVAHVYLTTTGHAPLAGISAMINGWEDVEQGMDEELPQRPEDTEIVDELPLRHEDTK